MVPRKKIFTRLMNERIRIERMEYRKKEKEYISIGRG